MDSLQTLQDRLSQSVFDKKVLSVIQHLHPYVKHRIYIAESTGILPINMYSSNGIIDDCIIKLYENGYDKDIETNDVKLKLLELIEPYLDTLFIKESFHKNTVSTHSILTEELQSLEEEYTIDADLDYVMNEDLDDISYKQDKEQKHLFLYNDNNPSILKVFELENVSALNSGRLLGTLYSWLPIRVSGIVDLYVLGKLSLEEISKIKHIEVSRVKTVLINVKKRFRKNLI